MAVGFGNYVVVVLLVGGSKAYDINSIYSVSPVPVKLGFVPVRFYLTKRMSTMPLANCSRKFTLL
jgi:hypothetical protein